MRRTKAVQGVAAAAAPFFALARPSSLHALTRSLQAFSTLAAALATSLAGSTFGGAFGIAHTHARRLAEGRARCRSAHPAIRASLSFVSSKGGNCRPWLAFLLLTGTSQQQLLGHGGGALGRAVGALEAVGAAAARELGDRAEGEDVAAGQHHGRVVGGGPFLGYGASEDLARREGEE